MLQLTRLSLQFLLAGLLLSISACSQRSWRASTTQPTSGIEVEVRPGGPLTFKSSEAQFDLLPSGCIQALLYKNGERLSLDEPGSFGSDCRDRVGSGGREVHFTLDFKRVNIAEARGGTGAVGKRIQITGRTSRPQIRQISSVGLYQR
jgi:hypothetical protein